MYLNDAYNFQIYILIFIYSAQLLSQKAISPHAFMIVLLIIFCNNTLFTFICAEYSNSGVLILNNISYFFCTLHLSVYIVLPDDDSAISRNIQLLVPYNKYTVCFV